VTKRLHLRLDDLSRHEFIVMARIRVFHALEGDANPACLDWCQVDADGDYRRTNALVDRLLDASIGGLPVAQALSERGVGLMQFAPSYVWPGLFVATQLAELLEPLFADTVPDVVVLHGAAGVHGQTWDALVVAFAAKVGARVERTAPAWRGVSLRLGERLKRKLRGWGVAYVVRQWKRRAVANAASDNVSLGAGRKRPVMFVTLGERHWKPTPEGLGADEQCYPIARALAAAGCRDLCFIDTQGVGDASLRQRDGDLAGGTVRWLRFSGFCASGLGYFFANWMRLNHLRRTAMTDPEFNRHLTYCGVSLVPALADTLREIFLDVAFEAREFLLAAARLVRDEAPAAIVLTYETGPAQRAMIIEAARAGIPTLGLQHGMVFDNHYDYMHARVSALPLVEPEAVAIPLITCVWGDYWRETLVSSGRYPADTVITTGNWRYDEIERIRAAAIARPLPLSQDQGAGCRIIAILTAGADIEEYVRICLRLVSGQGDAIPMVKLHPSENPESIRWVIAESGLPAETLYTGDLASLLVHSEIVISQFSTAVTEAMLFDKPVILGNLTGIEFTAAYQESNACLYATTAEDLQTCLGQLGTDPAVAGQLAEGRRRFVEQAFFRLDGASASRVAELVRAAAGEWR